ncbi:dTDP-4-dehydrorhamnose reductase [Anaeroselena agilis]|uniref:dTDP-4-dehydrorhamnose reductase n=1 Tax=Anaeroselena agilis TaxID=3063788 RepID=A0ABU3NSB8_9FIRM|nr:dTDP-4-dehydrorhamnose reductase [Selenomonadales bacterium 4137-cl]
MRLLITGGNGQLGRAFAALASMPDCQVLPLNSQELDVTDPRQLEDRFTKFPPDAVVHAGAYTAVDQAELEIDKAFRVNVVGTGNVAAACLKFCSKMVYISTDYVFDGSQNKPYTEFDRPNPLNVYGRTKLEGELLAARICPRLFVVRTSWLYGDGRNFVRTILKLAQEQASLSIVNDQTGTPTYAMDLARGILSLIAGAGYGTYHMSNSGQCTWYEFAAAILRLAGANVTIKPVSTAESSRPAVRPRYSTLRNYMQELTGGDCFRPWEAALADYIKQIKPGNASY